MRSRIVIILYTIVCLFILLNTAKDRHKNTFIYDKSGYHLHLPAAIIYKDLSRLEFYSYIDSVYQPSGPYWKNFYLYELDNGNRIDRYNIGVAVHELPFFLITHFINTTFLSYPADGYSTPYEWGGVISTLFWVLLGLLALRRLLLRYFSDGITAATLVAIAFGTHLYTYTVFSACMAHTYGFFHFSLILLLTDKLYSSYKPKYCYYLGIVFGLVAITRTSNLLVCLIPLLWGISSMAEIKGRIAFYRKLLPQMLMSGLLFFAVLMLQLGYWKHITGSWWYDGYTGEGFIWTEPMLWEGLFGFRKGWFVYTPVALVALIGLVFMRKSKAGRHTMAIGIFMVVNVYVVFCWWNWWYGGSFSARALIESMAVLAIPLAALLQWLVGTKSVVKYSGNLLLSLLVAFNLFQSYQYYRHVLLWDKMTKDYYMRVFLKTETDEADKALLMSEEEVQKELKRRQQLLDE